MRAVALLATIPGIPLGILAWPGQPILAGVFAGLILSAIVASLLSPRFGHHDIAALRLPAVVEFATLLIAGPAAMIYVAVAGAATRAASTAAAAQPRAQHALDIGAAAAASCLAGWAWTFAGGASPPLVWPHAALPVGAAVVAYGLVLAVACDVGMPLVRRRPMTRTTRPRVLRAAAVHLVGAAAALVMVEAATREAWAILALSLVPLTLAWRDHAAHATRREAEAQRRSALASLEHGAAVVDSSGRITLWNGALAALVHCPAETAVGKSLAGALPALGDTELPRVLDDVLGKRGGRSVPRLGLPLAAGRRVLHVDVLPEACGALLLWHDVTGQARASQALARDVERLTLAAEAANDGLWSWDLRTGEFHVSPRWRAILGLPAQHGPVRSDLWIARVHPDDVASLREALDAHLGGRSAHLEHEHRIRHEDGTYRWCLCRGRMSTRHAGRADRLAGSLTDVTQQTVERQQARSAGISDPLTGLSNRTVLVERLDRALVRYRERHDRRFGVLYLDLDRFKMVNDSLGHLAGDELLIAVSRRLESCLRPGDALARLGGDEFAILLEDLGDDMQANLVALRIQEALGAPFSVGGREVFTSVSIGIAFCRAEYTNPEELMRDADTAMYEAKARGKARHELFDADMRARAMDRLGLENDLRRAIKDEALQVHYQPIVVLDSGRCAGFESLIRWTRNGHPVSPADFVPVAEELGLIEPLGAWVLREACRRFADWRRRFPAAALDCITVNVSARQLLSSGFVRLVERVVEETGLRPRDLRLEITETALMDNPRDAAAVIGGLREFGVKIYLDDFGTGYSSLSHLHKLPVDALKIDRSFVRSLLLNDRPAIVESILALARTLDTGVIAEGVESELQARELERLGCRYAQGYFYSPPLARDAVDAMLARGTPLGRDSRTHVETYHDIPLAILAR